MYILKRLLACIAVAALAAMTVTLPAGAQVEPDRTQDSDGGRWSLDWPGQDGQVSELEAYRYCAVEVISRILENQAAARMRPDPIPEYLIELRSKITWLESGCGIEHSFNWSATIAGPHVTQAMIQELTDELEPLEGEEREAYIEENDVLFDGHLITPCMVVFGYYNALASAEDGFAVEGSPSVEAQIEETPELFRRTCPEVPRGFPLAEFMNCDCMVTMGRFDIIFGFLPGTHEYVVHILDSYWEPAVNGSRSDFIPNTTRDIAGDQLLIFHTGAEDKVLTPHSVLLGVNILPSGRIEVVDIAGYGNTPDGRTPLLDEIEAQGP